MNKYKNLRYINYFLIILIFLCALSQFLSYKMLLNDGARWYEALKIGKIVAYDHYHRFSTLIWQFLTFFFSNFFDGELRLSIMDFFFRFFYSFHPLISIAICYKILKQSDSQNLIILPALNYLLITLPAMSFACSSSVEAATHFWPLYFLTRTKELKVRDYVLYFILYLFLIFTYLQTIALSVVLILVSYINKEKHKLLQFNLVLIFIPIVFIIYKTFFFLSASKAQELLIHLNYLFENKLLFLYLPLLLLFIQFILLSFKKNKYIDYLFAIISLVATVIMVKVIGFNPDSPGTIVQSGFYYRIIIIPISALCIFTYTLIKWKKPETKPNWCTIFLIGLISISFTTLDLHTSFLFKKGVNNVRSTLDSMEDSFCLDIPEDEFYDKYTRYGLIPDFIPLMAFNLNQSIIFDKVLVSKIRGFWGVKRYPHLSICNSVISARLPIYINEINQFGLTLPIWTKKVQTPIYESLINNRLFKFTDKDIEVENEGFIAFDEAINTAQFTLKEMSSKIRIRAISIYPISIYLLGKNSEKKLKLNNEIIEVENLQAGKYIIKVVGKYDGPRYPILSPIQVIK